MKCAVLVATKANSIPIQECGGVVLAEGDKLIVTQEICDRMLLQYRGYLVQSGVEERETLRGTYYEYVHGKESKPTAFNLEEVAVVSSPLVDVSADKSFIGKAKRKIKGY